MFLKVELDVRSFFRDYSEDLGCWYEPTILIASSIIGLGDATFNASAVTCDIRRQPSCALGLLEGAFFSTSGPQ